MIQRPHPIRPVLTTLTLALALLPCYAAAAEKAGTRLLQSPAIADGKIAFVYADDIWVASADGSNPHRITSHPGAEQNPRFSPDGRHIAFTGSYDGNVDVYVISTDGGEPTRLTWHPGQDVVRGFTPRGEVLFSSQRSVFSRRHSQLFVIKPDGGVPERLPVPSAHKAAISPDGKFLAYTPNGDVFGQWKNYRGGTASRIWVLKLDGLSHDEIPKPSGGCNDTEPMWIGQTVYFLSDRDGEFNLYSYDPHTKAVAPLTDHDEFPVASASSGAGKLVYEQAGWIHVLDPGKKGSHQLNIDVAADLTETRPRFGSDPKNVRAFSISPSGSRAVLEYRGEIVTIPAKKGDPRNLSRSPGAHDRSPAWSPDGKSIAYFSDGTGEYQLIVRPQDGKKDGTSYPLHGSGFYEQPVWSPDSTKIAFVDNSRTLYYIDLHEASRSAEKGAAKRMAAEPIYGPRRASRTAYAWSPDSKWLAYSLTNRAGFQQIWLYSVEGDRSTSLTDGLAEAANPAFDKNGKYLYFLASTDAGPLNNWFDLSNTGLQTTTTIYLATLAKATANPLLKDSDEEHTDSAESKPAEEKSKDKAKKENAVPKTVVDLDGISSRVVPLPAESGDIRDLAAGAEDQIYYTRRQSAHGKRSLRRFDLKKREEETLADGVDEFQISADRKKILYAFYPAEQFGFPVGPPTLGLVDAGKFSRGDGSLPVAAISVRVEPRAEWAQMLREAWRINRDYFYATNMHGADWNAVWKKYEQFIPHLSTRDDLNRVIRMMLSELSVGHSGSGGGERLYEPKTIPVGLLGADYEVADGRFRFTTIFGGAYWDPNLRAPLRAPGVDVKTGDFLLALDGKDIKADSEVYRAFEGTAGKRVELTVGPHADGSGSRTVTVEPVADESSLRNRAWVEGNLHKVHERTNGRVAYVYVPNTSVAGYDYFKRYFFPQAGKDAIIVDERFNGGGQVADYYIDMLRKPLVSYWATRYGAPLRTPSAAILGPKVMITDETAGSGGDLLPWMFHKFGLGTLVGKKTWGGLVGILGFPELMDGGAVTAPDLAIFTEDGWIVENVGVPPDIDVEQDPALVAAGKDPQLDRAIEVILAELEKNPPPKPPARPPFPVRVRVPAKTASAK